jgi:hypothetical protein
LLTIASLESLTDTFGTDVPLCDVRRDILVCPQYRDNVYDGKVATKVHHGNVKVEANPIVLVVIETEIGPDATGQECSRFQEEERNDGKESQRGHDCASLGALQQIRRYLCSLSCKEEVRKREYGIED